jgi:hypothetical protein
MMVDHERFAARTEYDRDRLFGDRHLKFATREHRIFFSFLFDFATPVSCLGGTQLLDGDAIHRCSLYEPFVGLLLRRVANQADLAIAFEQHDLDLR